MKKRLKKLTVILMTLILCIGMMGCSSNNYDQQYKEANNLLKKGQYKKAKGIYKEVREYKDSKQKVKGCDFLLALEKSIVNRMNAPDDTSYSTLVDTELSYLEDYKNKDLGIKKITDACENYLNGLDIQKSSLDANGLFDSDYKWQQGLVKRYEILTQLYNDYSFLKDNKNFVGTYVKDVEEQKDLLKAYEEISNDIGSQGTGENNDFLWKVNDDTMETTIKNNTQRTFDITFYITYTTDDNKILLKDSFSETEIKPGLSYTIEFDTPNVNCNYDWEYQVDDVR